MNKYFQTLAHLAGFQTPELKAMADHMILRYTEMVGL